MDNDLVGVIEGLDAAFPTLTVVEAAALRSTVALLANGTPITPKELASNSDLPIDTFGNVLDRLSASGLVEYDSAERIVGCMGLSLTPTKHHFKVRKTQLYTWCALDTLFLPGLLEEEALVRSQCPATQTPIELRVSPDGVQESSLSSIVLSVIAGRGAPPLQGGASGFT